MDVDNDNLPAVNPVISKEDNPAMQNHWNLTSKQFEKAVEENTYGHACGVCDRLWFEKDLRHTKKQFIIDLLKSEFPFDKVEEFRMCSNWSLRRYCGMYAREVDVTRLRKRALLGNGRPQQYPDGVFYRVGPQAINPRERS
jgi:hypothetical protein